MIDMLFNVLPRPRTYTPSQPLIPILQLHLNTIFTRFKFPAETPGPKTPSQIIIRMDITIALPVPSRLVPSSKSQDADSARILALLVARGVCWVSGTMGMKLLISMDTNRGHLLGLA